MLAWLGASVFWVLVGYYSTFNSFSLAEIRFCMLMPIFGIEKKIKL